MRVRVCDPNLRDFVGHNFSLNILIAELLNGTATVEECKIWSNKSSRPEILGELGAPNVKPVFRHVAHPRVFERSIPYIGCFVVFSLLFFPIILSENVFRRCVISTKTYRKMSPFSASILEAYWFERLIRIIAPFR